MCFYNLCIWMESVNAFLHYLFIWMDSVNVFFMVWLDEWILWMFSLLFAKMNGCIWFVGVWHHFHQYFSYIMATSFRGGKSRSIRREPPTMGKQLIIFITCGCESSAPFFNLQSWARTHAVFVIGLYEC
jgi:hypothetical protein